MSDDDPVEIPITGELDLHTFNPREVAALLPDYLEACRERGILTVRIIHGKGMGVLRVMAHNVLRKLPIVLSYRLGDERTGGWGATIVELRPR